MHEEQVKRRIWLLGGALALALLGLVWRLCCLHLGDQEPVSRPWETKLNARRGAIYDRNGDPLAVSLIAYQPFLDPLAIKPRHDKVKIAATLADAAKLETDRILEQFAITNARHQLLPALVEEKVCKAMLTNKAISGVGWEERIVRTYPQGRRMAGVLGFVNNDGAGGAGIEQHFDSYLKGIPGRLEGQKDGLQREIRELRTADVPPVDGASIHLTLDNNIQYKVENELQQVAQEFNASGAWALVEKIDTGEILAMASWPDFDPNDYRRAGPLDWRNLPICVNYEPGSTMKAFTFAAALNEGVITPATRLDVGFGSWFYGGRVLHDHAEGVIDAATALKKSSNIYTAKVALMLGNRRLEAYLRAFGFGERLGVDLPGEERGILPRSRNWNILTPTRVAIGQGVAVTSLQILNAYCAIANGGRLMRPYVVARIVSAEGQLLYRAEPRVLANPIRPESAAAVRKMLVGVTEEGGTATRAQVHGYSVAGKTGTAQIPLADGRGYSDKDFWASFVGFVPAEQPVFGVLVAVERPHPQHMGGFVAAPVFARIAEATARYLEVPASPDAEEAAAAAAAATSATPATPHAASATPHATTHPRVGKMP
jgi:cell division protein FtsI (penicillin-binding protein 3)